MFLNLLFKCIIGFIFGFIGGLICATLEQRRKTYGELLIDQKTNQCIVRLNSDELLNPKLRTAELTVRHIDIPQEKPTL